MFSALLARITPYAFAALGISILVNIALGHELLASQRDIGQAIQDGNVRVLQSALSGSQAAQKAQSKDDSVTINQLQDALAREDIAAQVRDGDLQRTQAALTAANRRLNDVFHASPDAAAWAAAHIPPGILTSGLCWYDPSAGGYTRACDSAGSPVRPHPGGRH